MVLTDVDPLSEKKINFHINHPHSFTSFEGQSHEMFKLCFFIKHLFFGH
jgi:hypothetical protein